MGATTIEWTRSDDGTLGKTWNPTRGCSRVSAGCGDSSGGGCYAERQAHRFSGPGQPYEGLTRMTAHGPRWTGTVRLVPEVLDQPLRWKRPRRIFVNSMSDLFHEDLPDEAIDQVFAVMAAAKWHTFQVLTKRAERMHRYLTRHDVGLRWWKAWVAGPRPEDVAVAVGWTRDGLPNVWLIVSAENQETADERVPLLLRTPAAVRGVSAEPLLAGVDLAPAWTRAQRGCAGTHVGPCGVGRHHHHDEFCGPRLDWVIVGGESGPGARLCKTEWVRALVAQCQAAEVPVFVKQLGALPWDAPMPHPDDAFLRLRDKKGGDMDEWPADLRVREFPRVEQP